MNLFIVGRFGTPRRVDLLQPRLLAMAGGGMILLLGLLFLAGYTLGDRFGAGTGTARLELAHLLQELEEQRSELAAARNASERDVDALAVRLGQLQAQAVRINALGQRLAEMGGMDSEEFNFDEVPALGGPEMPIARSNVHDLTHFSHALQQRFESQRRQLAVLEELLMGRELEHSLTPTGRPINQGWLTSNFGQRLDPFTGHPSMHEGLDFSGAHGSDILAAAGGVVTWSGLKTDLGLTVDIDHGNGYMTRYAHNSSTAVAVGDRVHAGEVIATMGDTGRATATHLHFEVWKDGRPIDPRKMLQADRG